MRNEAMVSEACITQLRTEHEIAREKAHRQMEHEVDKCQVIYLPIIVAEAVWDFTDSVCDGLVILRDPEFKRTTRKLREMRRDYRSHFISLGVDIDGTKVFAENFVENIGDAKSVTRELSKALDGNGIRIPSDRRGLVLAAYVAECFAEGLRRYSLRKESELARKVGLKNHGTILPESFLLLPSVLRNVTARYRLPPEITAEVSAQICDFLIITAEEMAEDEERMRYRTACVAYRNNGGCRGQARRGAFGCYPTSRCKRMVRYDKEQEQKQS